MGSRTEEVASERSARDLLSDGGRSSVAAGVDETATWRGTAKSWDAGKTAVVVVMVSRGCISAVGNAGVTAGPIEAGSIGKGQGPGELEGPGEVQVTKDKLR